MTPFSQEQIAKFIRGISVRQVRLGCGLVLFAYLVSHFLNHALVITHLAGVRFGQTLFGHEKLYPQVLFAYWIVWPLKMWLMYAVMIIAWIHGCIGLYFWLRLKAFYQRAAPFLLGAAVLVPTLAMLGLYQGGRSVVDSDSVKWRTENLSPRRVGTPAEQA